MKTTMEQFGLCKIYEHFRFANVAMKMNDPLQTLYQLMSGRQPAAVTVRQAVIRLKIMKVVITDRFDLKDICFTLCVLQLVIDDKWGDWRPHLAMVLANQSQRPDVDRKSIVTLGDTLGMDSNFLFFKRSM